MQKSNILYKIYHKILLKNVSIFEHSSAQQKEATAIFLGTKRFHFIKKKKYEKYLQFILDRTKFEADIFQDTIYIETFVDMRSKCIKDLQFLSIFDLFTSRQKPSYYLELFSSMREKMEIDFLRRSYERDRNGLLVISISDMTIINKNFSQKAIDFIIKDDTDKMQYQIKNFDYMDGYEFETFCSDILVKFGYTNVTVTQSSADQGIDVLAEKDGVRFAIQCKHYSGTVGNKAVQEAYSGCKFYDCHVPVVMTNSHFTDSAKQLAEKNNVLLWDRDVLLSYIEKGNNND